MSAVIVIPARYASTRFPGKPLSLLKGSPLIQHVYERAKGSRLAGDVIVATDSWAIFECVQSFGGRAEMTSVDHASGTDRVAEVARKTDYDIIVNVQGDEPMIRPEMIDAAIGLLSDNRADIGTLAKRITNPAEIADPNAVKVVFNEEGFALYFSRSPIPYHRDLFGVVGHGSWVMDNKDSFLPLAPCPLPPEFDMFKHIGIYAYRRDVLLNLTVMKQSKLEETERLEQLRALENNFRIKVKETVLETIGVDTPQDLERAEEWLSSYS